MVGTKKLRRGRVTDFLALHLEDAVRRQKPQNASERIGVRADGSRQLRGGAR
jgi:hypothetical protein